MDKRKFFLVPYMKHLLRLRSGYDIHSPFIFKFYKDILKDRTQYPEYKAIKNIRKKLLNSAGTIHSRDYRAISTGQAANGNLVPVSKIVKSSSVKSGEGQFLFRLVRHFKPRIILEMGTSFGISTMYMALGHPQSDIITIEGNSEIIDIAKGNFNELAIKNIRPVQGLFDEILPFVLSGLPAIDLVFFDGNHKKEPALHYFYQCLKHKHRDSLFIFHDIHWSEGMEQAWNEIRSDPAVTVTIDLFRMGLVFFDDHLSKEDFIMNWR